MFEHVVCEMPGEATMHCPSTHLYLGAGVGGGVGGVGGIGGGVG